MNEINALIKKLGDKDAKIFFYRLGVYKLDFLDDRSNLDLSD